MALMKKSTAPGFFTRASQAVRYTISGVKPSTWMSPLQPLVPYSPVDEDGRQFDYQVGRNLFYKPRGTERVQFQELRNAARYSEILRLAIETRLDQMDALEWKIKPRDDSGADDKDPRIKTISEFFEKPDQVHDWPGWLRLVLEELLVTDAVSIYRRMNRGGTLYGLEPRDGSTIFPLIDEDGRTPQAPDPAYQQVLKGVPKVDFTADQLIYAVRKTQVNTPYGWSPTEQVIESARTDIERIKYQLAYFTEGSLPDAYVTAPDGMTPDKVKAFEAHINSLLSGNAAQRRQLPFLIYGMEIHQMKEPPLKSEIDEWLARKVCFAFSLPPTAFVRQTNRATAQTAQEAAIQEGLAPLMLWVKRLMDRVIKENFDAPELEWGWVEDKAQDPKEAADVDKELTGAGIMTINEVRNARGLDDIEGGDIAMIATPTGYVPIDAYKDQMALQQKQADAAVASAKQPKGEQQSSQAGQNAGKSPSGVAKPKSVKKKTPTYGASTFH